MIHRRNLFRSLMAISLWPFTSVSRSVASPIEQSDNNQVWPKDNDPNYWRWIRKQFLLPADEGYFNSGTLGARPRQVTDAVIKHMLEVEKKIAHYDYKNGLQYIAGYDDQIELRRKIGILINADWREVAILQNSTMGLSFIANGLDLKAGDEILITDQEHPSSRGCWELKAKRTGAIVQRLQLPAPAIEPEAVVKLFSSAITPKTRVISLPHITTRYANLLPVTKICEVAKRQGIFSLIDGAQSIGQFRVNVKDIGCDAYVTSPQKYLLAPAGNGILYIRQEKMKDVWATLAGGHWNDPVTDGLFRLMQYGTTNMSVLIGLNAAIDFHNKVGTERIEKRIQELIHQLRNGLQKINGATVLSSTHPEMISAAVFYKAAGLTGKQLQDELWSRGKIRVRVFGDEGVRQCVHIYNSPEEIDRTIEVVKLLAKNQHS